MAHDDLDGLTVIIAEILKDYHVEFIGTTSDFEKSKPLDQLLYTWLQRKIQEKTQKLYNDNVISIGELLYFCDTCQKTYSKNQKEQHNHGT